MQFQLSRLAESVGGTVEGDEFVVISGLAKIEEAKEGDLSFIANPKYAKFAETTSASALIVSRDFPEIPLPTIRVSDPYAAFMKAAILFSPKPVDPPPGVDETAVVDPSARLGKDVAIGPLVVIGAECEIGDGTRLHPGVVMADGVTIGRECRIYPNVSVREGVVVGDRVVIHNGTVLGSDGFGFAQVDGVFQKVPQSGIVVIEDDVEIGANCAIDRGTMGATRIRKGAKLDNLIQIAHNVEIGEHTVIAAQAGIAGSTRVGKGVMMGGQVGIVGHLEIGDGARLAAQAGVTKSIEAGMTASGYPARSMPQVKRQEAALQRLPDLLKRVAALEKELNRLKDEA